MGTREPSKYVLALSPEETTQRSGRGVIFFAPIETRAWDTERRKSAKLESLIFMEHHVGMSSKTQGRIREVSGAISGTDGRAYYADRN